MNDTQDLFKKIIIEFHKKDILIDLILIGSWCLVIYREYFNRPPEIPLLRTVDLDFLVPNPPKITNEVDIPNLLKSYGFDEEFSVLGGFSKFVHPELEIEFLTPKYGRGRRTPHNITELKISAQGLRYVGLVQQYNIEVMYIKTMIRVPEPSAFVLLKFLTSTKRKEKAKLERDISTGKQVGEYLITQPQQKAKMKEIFSFMPKRWQITCLDIIRQNSYSLYEVLLS